MAHNGNPEIRGLAAVRLRPAGLQRPELAGVSPRTRRISPLGKSSVQPGDIPVIRAVRSYRQWRAGRRTATASPGNEFGPLESLAAERPSLRASLPACRGNASSRKPALTSQRVKRGRQKSSRAAIGVGQRRGAHGSVAPRPLRRGRPLPSPCTGGGRAHVCTGGPCKRARIWGAAGIGSALCIRRPSPPSAFKKPFPSRDSEMVTLGRAQAARWRRGVGPLHALVRTARPRHLGAVTRMGCRCGPAAPALRRAGAAHRRPVVRRDERMARCTARG